MSAENQVKKLYLDFLVHPPHTRQTAEAVRYIVLSDYLSITGNLQHV